MNKIRISAINPKFLKPGDYEKLMNGEAVPFARGKVRKATKEEIESIEKRYNQKYQYSEKFIPIVWLD